MPFDPATGKWTRTDTLAKYDKWQYNSDNGVSRWGSGMANITIRQAAWMCNQTDYCSGFTYYTGSDKTTDGNGGAAYWNFARGPLLYSDFNGPRSGFDYGFGAPNYPSTTMNYVTTYDYYRKNARAPNTVYTVPTFDATNNTGDPSIISTAQGASTFPNMFGGGVNNNTNIIDGSNGGTCKESDSEWTKSFPSGTYNACNGDFPNDSVSGYMIPIGWKWLTTENCNDGYGIVGDKNGDSESYLRNFLGYNNGRPVVPHEPAPPSGTNVSDPTSYAACTNTVMNDNIVSSAIFEQIGFDVPTHWDDMVTSGGLTPTEQKTIQTNWCNAVTQVQTLAGNKDSSGNTRCSTLLGTEAYNTLLLKKCQAMGDWTLENLCLKAVAESIQNNDETNGNNSTATAMVQKFCRGGDGSNPKGIGPGRSTTGLGNRLCGCLNAHDFGVLSTPPDSNCYTYPNMAGCTQVVAKTKDVINYSTPAGVTFFNAAVSDPGKLASDCTTARQPCTDSGCVLPYDPNAANITEITNICSMVSSQGLAQNSPVRQDCTFNAPPGSTPTPGSVPGLQKTPTSSTTSSSSGKSNTPLFIGGGVCCFCVCLIIIMALVMMPS